MSKEEILECNFNPTHTKKHANSYKNIRPNIPYPRTTPLPSEKKNPSGIPQNNTPILCIIFL